MLWVILSSPKGMELLSLPWLSRNEIKASETALSSGQGKYSKKLKGRNSDF